MTQEQINAKYIKAKNEMSKALLQLRTTNSTLIRNLQFLTQCLQRVFDVTQNDGYESYKSGRLIGYV